MPGEPTPTLGERLASLRARSGLSLTRIAEGGGWRGASSVQRYFEADYDARPMSTRVAARFSRALAGRGEPPITHEEIAALAGLPPPARRDGPHVVGDGAPRHLIDVTDLPVDARLAIETLVGRLRETG